MSNYVYMGATPFALSIPTSAFKPGGFSRVLPLQNLAKMRFTASDFTKSEQVQGHAYLTQQWVEQAFAARRAGVQIKTPVAVKLPNGKVSVPVGSLWSDWNQEGAKALRPVAGAIRSFTLLPVALREKLLTRPLDALLDLFNPLFARLAAPCRRTMQQHLRGGRRVEWFGKYLDIRIDQPAIDNKLDASTKNLLRKLRTIQAFIICFIKKPLEFAGECLKEGIDIVSDVAGAVGGAVGGAVESIGNAAKAVGEAVGDVAKRAAEEASKAVAGVASFFGSLTGLSGLGDGGLGDGGLISGPAAGGAAAGTTTICGVVIENSLILGVIGAIVAAATTLGVVAIQTSSQERLANAAFDKDQPVSITSKAPDGTTSTFTSGQPPTQVDPRAAAPEALADDEVGPPGAPRVDAGTLRAESASSGGFPVVPVALAAGVALLLLSRR